MTDYSYTDLDRVRDAVANSDWQDIGRTDPYTIAEGYAFFDRVIRQVKADTLREAADWKREHNLGHSIWGKYLTELAREKYHAGGDDMITIWLNDRADLIERGQ